MPAMLPGMGIHLIDLDEFDLPQFSNCTNSPPPDDANQDKVRVGKVDEEQEK